MRETWITCDRVGCNAQVLAGRKWVYHLESRGFGIDLCSPRCLALVALDLNLDHHKEKRAA